MNYHCEGCGNEQSSWIDPDIVQRAGDDCDDGGTTLAQFVSDPLKYPRWIAAITPMISPGRIGNVDEETDMAVGRSRITGVVSIIIVVCGTSKQDGCLP